MTGGIEFTPGLFRGHGPRQALKAQTAWWGWTQSRCGEECGGRARECGGLQLVFAGTPPLARRSHLT